MAIVTGGSQGIGRGICLTAAAHGAHVVVHHLNSESSRMDAEAVKAEVEKLGRRAVLVEGDIADPRTATEVRQAPTIF